MATGRGKSLMLPGAAPPFARAGDHAREPVRVPCCGAHRRPGVPSADERSSAFGIASAVITGRIDARGAPRQVFAGLADGSLDIVLTTPEFLHVPHRRVGAPGARRASSWWTRRTTSAWPRRASAWPTPPSRRPWSAGPAAEAPLVLALTATADDAVADAIRCACCPFDGLGHRRRRPATTCAWTTSATSRTATTTWRTSWPSGEKTVIYVNSREQSVARGAHCCAGACRSCACIIGFYNAGLSHATERKRIEELFRTRRR
ncbi:MAG: hypothetical protein ACLTDR_15350 [Adlercreutzia equolifaciens]